MASASMSLAVRAAPSGLLQGASAGPLLSSTARPTGVARCAASAAGTSSADAVIAPVRKNWLPGSTPPAYLDGSLAGDTGFDPLGLADDPEALRWYVQAELIHSRLAMAGVAGMLGTDILRTSGIAPGLPVWFEAGAEKYSLADTPTLLAVQLILYAFVEFKRWGDFKAPGSQGDYKQAFFFFIEPALAGTANGYPGGPLFDPLSLAVDFESPEVKDLKDKELANGRLAMLAALGFFVQAKVTGAGPVEDLLAHLADPWHTTVLSFLP